ncbi:MAG: ferrous iron transport protein B [Planctomycetota bacterium]|nr:MAG: ferrous iron transport protein B [Planctomycetota bacterium]
MSRTEPVSAPPRVHKVALLGNPNTGKSTIFNALCGMKARVGHYPGVTVEKKIGRMRTARGPIDLVDLPGTYSLSPRTLDEMVSVNVLLGRQPDIGEIDAAVCIADASTLERNLYLLSQLLDLGVPVVLVLNMWDVALRRGIEIDIERLSERLGIPVVTTTAHRGEGIDRLRELIEQACFGDRIRRARFDEFPPEFYDECRTLNTALRNKGIELPDYLIERLILDVGGETEREVARWWVARTGPTGGNHAGASDPRTPSAAQHSPENGDGAFPWISARQRLRAAGIRIPGVEAQVRYSWIRRLIDQVVRAPAQRPRTLQDRVDDLLTHRFLGLVVFLVIMFVVFQAVYAWAEPLIGVCEASQAWAEDHVAAIVPPGPLRSLLADGVIAGVGAVLVFLPQIAILFFFIAVLEDCGYMARAAFLMDKLMTRFGLSGKSFVPLMSSFACAVPGVMATRVIDNYRDRMVTILVAPLMSCSARLPVYLLMIGAFVPEVAYLGGWIELRGLVLFAMLSLGAVVAIPVAWLLKKTVFRGEPAPFVMELPSYKWPSPKVVVVRVYDRSAAFVKRAGTLIFAATILIWAATYFPGDHRPLDEKTAELERLQAQQHSSTTGPSGGKATDHDDPTAVEARIAELTRQINDANRKLVATSFLGRTGKLIEPAVRPLGWDWRLGVGVLAAFPAREVIISTLGTIYSLGGDVDEQTPGLRAALKSARWPDGRPVYNLPVAVSIMVFFALCSQCVSTLVVIGQETNSWRWPVFCFTYMTALAYLGALLSYQLGMRLAG